MHQALSMHLKRMSNLWHTRKWNSSYPGPDWKIYPAPKFPPDPQLHQIYPSRTIPTSCPDQRDEWTWRSPRKQYRLFRRTCNDYLKYDSTEILDLLKTAQESPVPFLLLLPNNLSNIINLKPLAWRHPEWKHLPGMVTPTASICGYHPAPNHLTNSTATASPRLNSCCKPCPLTRKAPLSTSTAGKSSNSNWSTNLEI